MEHVAHRLARRFLEVLGKDQLSDAEQSGDGTSEQEPNTDEGGEVVVELTEDERGPARRSAGVRRRCVQAYQPLV